MVFALTGGLLMTRQRTLFGLTIKEILERYSRRFNITNTVQPSSARVHVARRGLSIRTDFPLIVNATVNDE